MNDITPIAIPSAGRMAARMQSSSIGSRFEDVLLGRRIVWEVVRVPGDKVERATMVYGQNERAQELLDGTTLADILATLDPENGNDTLAKGRRVNGIIEVADGSRRRGACIIKPCPYNILVCDDLTDAEMDHLTDVGNVYNPPSSWEKGHTYARMERQLGSLRKVEEALQARGMPISRRTITRCIKTAEIPLEVMKWFKNPGSLSPADGELIAANLAAVNLDQLEHDWMEQDSGEDPDEVLVTFLKSWRPLPSERGGAQAKPAIVPIERSWGKNKLLVKGNKLTLQLTKAVPAEARERIEQAIAAIMDGLHPAEPQAVGDAHTQLDLDVSMPAWFPPSATVEMYAEYSGKMDQICQDFDMARSSLEPLVIAMCNEKAVNEAGQIDMLKILLNIRSLRATCRELLDNQG